MDDLSLSEALKMQYELWEKNKEAWSPLDAKYARNSLLWMIAEIGEVIDIIKKCGEDSIMEDAKIKSAFIEELCDVLMYFNDTLLRFDISPKDMANAYINKHKKNMNRSFKIEEKAFSDKLKM